MAGVRQAAPLSEAVLTVASDAVVVFDILSGELVWGNRSFATAEGHPGDPFSDLVRFADLCAAVHGEDRRALDRILSGLAIDAPEPRNLRLRLRDSSGQWRWAQLWVAPRTIGPGAGADRLVCTVRDIDETVRSEQHLLWQTRHDTTTGLANRRVISETLRQVAGDPADPRRYAYFVDIDDFRKVNDALGHSAGDQLIGTLAARIALLLADGDVLGRFGGDELVVISALEPAQLAANLLATVGRRAVVAGVGGHRLVQRGDRGRRRR